MVYIRYPNFKSGIRPSQATTFNFKNMSPTDKLTLARNRIWGNNMGSAYKTGGRIIRKPWNTFRMVPYQFGRYEMIFPGLKNHNKQNYEIEKFEYRRMRILMRGIKTQKGKKMDESTMAIFSVGDQAEKVKRYEKSMKEKEERLQQEQQEQQDA